MGMVDTLMASRIGSESVAAVGMAGSIFFAVFVAAMGIVLGIDPLVSHAVGAKDENQWQRMLVAGRWIGVLAGLPVMAVAWAIPPLLLQFGYDPGLISRTSEYLNVLCFGTIPMLLATVYSVYLTAHGHSKQFLYATVLGNLLNVGFNAWFIGGGLGIPALGVRGIALSTVASSCFELALLNWWMRDASPLGYTQVKWGRPQWTALVDILKMGTPIAGQYFLEVAGFSAGAVMLGWLGEEIMAGHQVAISIASLTFSVALGVGMAGSVRVGQAYGRRDKSGVRRSGKITLICALIWALFTAAVFGFGRHVMADFYADSTVTRTIAAQFIGVAAIFQIADCTQAAGFGVLRGMGDTRVPATFNFVAYWIIGLPLGWWMTFRTPIGALGIWYAFTTALTLVALALVWRFFRLNNRLVFEPTT